MIGENEDYRVGITMTGTERGGGAQTKTRDMYVQYEGHGKEVVLRYMLGVGSGKDVAKRQLPNN